MFTPSPNSNFMISAFVYLVFWTCFKKNSSADMDKELSTEYILWHHCNEEQLETARLLKTRSSLKDIMVATYDGVLEMMVWKDV